MKTISAVALALTLATGAAFAQGSGGGGTETGKSGTSTGKEAAAMNPTPAQCAKGWDASMRISEADFKAKCKK